jgi:prevent-host-death family protein
MRAYPGCDRDPRGARLRRGRRTGRRACGLAFQQSEPELQWDAEMEGHRSATMTHMELVGIREMRQNLSRYAQRARHGESFLITDRGQEVAQLTPAPGRASVIDRLVAERGAMRGQGNLLDVLEELPAPIPGPPSSEVLGELRSERL